MTYEGFRTSKYFPLFFAGKLSRRPKPDCLS